MEKEEGCYNVHHPLFNIHVLEIIFDHCNIKSLLLCRLVCQTWNNEAVRILEKKEVTAHIKGCNAITNFLTCMKTSRYHPFSSFSIELPQNTTEACKLLNVLKHRMRHVKFEYELPMSSSELTDENETITNEESESSETIVLPHLTSLYLFSTNIFPPSSDTNPIPKIFSIFKIPSLNSLSIQHLYPTECAPTILRLLNTSKSNISSLRIRCTEFPKISGQINLTNLRELDICDLFHGSFATNDTLQSIKDNCPQLTFLSIELGCRVTFDCIFRLLQNLQHSLQNLKLTIQDKNLLYRNNIQRVNFYFPHLPKLKSLFLRYANPGLVYYIDSMPMLEYFESETPWTRKVRGNLFPGIQDKVYSNLKSLHLSEKLTVEDLKLVHKLFPNLKTLSASFKCNEALLEVYRNFTNLQSLTIDRNSVTITDEGICGESGSLSIINLKDLRVLKLVQAGLSWKSLIQGVCHLRRLHTIAVQATTLKHDSFELIKDNNEIVKQLNHSLPRLKKLSIWIRRNSEKLSQTEMKYLLYKYPQWEIDFALQATL